jgi:hypothetical protein
LSGVELHLVFAVDARRGQPCAQRVEPDSGGLTADILAAIE